MPTKIHSCLEQHLQIQQSTVPSPKELGEVPTVGEVYTIDDHESVNFNGYNNQNRSKVDIKKWAEDTKSLGEWSNLFHLIEIPLKIISYFVSFYSTKKGFWSRGFFALERLADTLGGMFRNNIYNHRDSRGNKDDNLGAEDPEKNKSGDHATHWISTINHFLQTKGRFLIPVIGLFSPTLANELDWGVLGTVDSIRWKRAASNSAFYPGFLQDLYLRIFNMVRPQKSSSNNNVPIWKVITSQIKKHFNDARSTWREFKSATSDGSERKKILRNFYKDMDQLTSAFLSFSQWPNMIGDITRPIFRRANSNGFLRNASRILSVIDRPFMWANYLFRFYLQDNIAHREPFRFSNLFMLGTIGDVIDFTATLFEDKIKKTNSWLQHSLEMIRILKSSALKIFFSGRRVVIGERTTLNSN